MISNAVGFTTPAQATAGSINNQINFQGRLLNASGAVVADGNYNMQFKIYKDGDGAAAGDTGGSGGTLLWTEAWLGVNSQAVIVKNGYFSVNLGSITSLTGVDFNQSVLWLSQNVAGGANATSASCGSFAACNSSSDPELLPMRRLASAVYALQANSCTTCVLQAPTSTAQNTIAPTTASVVGLTVNGSSNATGAVAVDIQQTRNFANLTTENTGATSSSLLNVSQSTSAYTGTAILVNVAAGSGSFASGAFVDLQANGTSKFKIDNLGALTLAGAQAADITTLAGTAPTALVFQPGNNTTATSTGASFTVQAGNDSGATAATGGLLTLKGGDASVGTTKTGGGVTIDSGAGATAGGAINMGTVNAATIQIGSSALGAGTQTISIGNSNTAGGTQNVTIGTGPSAAAGTTTVRAKGALTFTGGAASTWDIGANTLSLQTTGNGAITTGTGLLTQGGNITFSGTTARTITGPTTGGLTINDTTGNLTVSTTTSGTLAVSSAGALNLTGAAASTLNVGANTLTVTSGGASAWTNTSGNLSVTTATSGNITVDAVGSLALNGTNFDLATTGVLTLAGAQTADITTAAGTSPTALIFQPGNNTTATSTGAAFTLQAGNDSGATAATGGLLTLKGGNATGGSQTGGGVTIDSGSGTAGGAINIGNTNAASINIGKTSSNIATTVTGTAVFKPVTDSASAFQIQNANSVSVLNVSSTLGKVTVSQGALAVNGLSNPAAPTLALTSTGGTLANATTYTYLLAATNGAGETQAIASSPVSTTTANATSLNTITWSAVTNATGYKLYRSTDGGTTWFVNTLGLVTSAVDNGSNFTWATSPGAGFPSQFANDTGDIFMTAGASLVLDAGGNGTLKYNAVTKAVSLSSAASGGIINLQADSYNIKDATGFNEFQLANAGAAIFKNRTNSANGFQVFSSGGTSLFNIDTSGGAITAGLWNGTAIGAPYGGTGQTTYAVGDLLYASTTSALSRLADVASGSCLVSGGVGVAPSWTTCPGGAAGALIQVPTTTATNTIAPTAASVVALTVKGTNNASSANVLEVFDSTTTPARQAFFDATGSLNVSKVIQPTATNTIDLGLTGTQFRTGYFGTSVLTPTLDTNSGVALNIGTTTATNITLGRATQVVSVPSGLDITSAYTGSDTRVNIGGSLTSSNTVAQYGLQNQISFTPAGASLTDLYGLANIPSLGSSSKNVTTVHGVFSRVDTVAGYTGQITTGAAFEAGNPQVLGTKPIQAYSGLLIQNNTGNVGISGNTATNYGVNINTPGANSAFTTNYGLYIQGNGGGSATNYSLYNSSTAISYFAGDVTASTKLLTPLLDAPSAVALNIGTTNASVINLNENTTVAAGKNLSLASGTGTFTQAFTGTTTVASTITANSLTSGSALQVNSTNNTAANTSWSAIDLNVVNGQGTTAVSGANIIAGLDVQMTQSPTVAGNVETVANFSIAANAGTPTDSTVASILNLSNNDTATGNLITVTDALKINGGSNIVNGINLSGTFTGNLISSTNFNVTQAGQITAGGSVLSSTLDRASAGVLTIGAANATSIQVGGATNNMTFASTGEPTLNGTARHTRQILLSPEYAGATMTADGTNNGGTMTSDNMTTTPFKNYYQWANTAGTAQDYDIWVKIPVPSDFSALPSGQTICLDTYASATTANGVKLNALYDTTNTAVTITTTDLTPTSITTWQNKCSSSITSGTFAAGGVITVDLKLTAPATTGIIRIGDLSLSYLSMW